jgi:hypothetical protein
MVHGQLARKQVEIEAHDARHGLQPIADEPLLGRAIHVLDAPARAARALGRWNLLALALCGRVAARRAVGAALGVAVSLRIGFGMRVGATAGMAVVCMATVRVPMLACVVMLVPVLVCVVMLVVVLVPASASQPVSPTTSAAGRPFLITRAQALRSAKPRQEAQVHRRSLSKVNDMNAPHPASAARQWPAAATE